MSKAKGILASRIIVEHFGDIVEKVASLLIQSGRATCADICKSSNLSKEEVKKTLLILIKHNLVTFQKRKTGQTEYHIELDNVLLRRRFQKYVYCAKVRFDDVAELIVETLLLNGCDTISRIAKHVADRIELDGDKDNGKADIDLVVSKCKELITERFIMRVPNPNRATSESNKESDDLKEKEEQERFAVPEGIGVKRKATASPPDKQEKKKVKVDSGDTANEEMQYADDGIYWRLNVERFHQCFIDQLIIDAVRNREDQCASNLVKTLLKMTEKDRTMHSPASRSISIYDIMKNLPNIPKLDQKEVQQYLTQLSDEKTGGYMTKTDEAGGGMYAVNLKHSVSLICQSVCATIVQERFGSKASRVFRLLLQKRHLEQKQIGELAMIPFKDVKELLYKLFEERMVKMQEITKSADYAPSRTFYLFTVDIPQVSRLLLSRCYQAIGNMMVRRDSEEIENKRLLEKNEKIDGILSALSGSTEETEQVIQEIEELVTPTEKQQLDTLKVNLDRLEQGEIQIEETVFILQTYLMYC